MNEELEPREEARLKRRDRKRTIKMIMDGAGLRRRQGKSQPPPLDSGPTLGPGSPSFFEGGGPRG